MPRISLVTMFTALLLPGCETRAADLPAQHHAPPAPSLHTHIPPWLTLSLGAPVSGFQAPVHITAAHDGSNRLFVVEQTGRVRVMERVGAESATVRAEPFLDVRDLLGNDSGEQGLLGLAFHPRFKENGRLFIAYTNAQEDDAVAELRANETRASAVRGSLRPLCAVEDFAGNHNGGHLAFSNDGLLFIGTGDGGGGGDPQRTAQDPKSLLGKMLVLNVDKLPPAGAVKPTIRYDGLRNPWRYAFDRVTGDLWIADVGQNKWEEVHFVEAARLTQPLNFGWSRVEAAHCFRPGSGCDAAGTEPVAFEYPHGDDGCSITGGVVFRSASEPFADGTYVVGDYCSGRVWIMKRNGARFDVAQALDTGLRISSFGTDESGGVWLVDHAGSVRRVHAKANAPAATPAPTPAPSPLPPATK
jgi:glucose/arabinose dehydrogenase